EAGWRGMRWLGRSEATLPERFEDMNYVATDHRERRSLISAHRLGLAKLVPAPSPQLPPDFGINRERLDTVRGEINEGPVVLDRTVAEQARQQSEGMIGERLVQIRLLPIQAFQRAAAWQSVVIARGVDKFRQELGSRSQACRAPPVPPVPRLAEHELAAC